jgi:hypothetical protein
VCVEMDECTYAPDLSNGDPQAFEAKNSFEILHTWHFFFKRSRDTGLNLKLPSIMQERNEIFIVVNFDFNFRIFTSR